ncbi:tetraacyldisaccharide 4'-kinase [Sphingobacterium sp. 1.A.5]|uniref:tetraacyldisaccharide 4'-kinase n=1 Tax=Sphingobacterium sp. 1.A.5 TaxID=2044604 RepID=UPI000C0BEE3F|nr:tetraacyldisaccharide 4'-kinase [Sphingobacterium sp. 1.A.5]
MQWLRWLLFPFTILYTLIIWVRNKLYDLNFFPSRTFPVKTIVVGNLAVGGAGKSPLTQKLIQYFSNKYRVATLSRGYGRKTKGFRLVEVEDSVENVGDEPLQLKKNFPNITIAVDENRTEGIEILQKDHDLIILDDAFQHRKVTPKCSILLFEYSSILNPIFLLPTGNYRDTFNQTKRADIVLITKCPDEIPAMEKNKIESKIRSYNKTTNIYYSKIGYKELIPISEIATGIKGLPKNVLLVTGIANPQPLAEYLRINAVKKEHLKFPDHHNFDEFDYKVINARFEKLNADGDCILLTTEKDAQRLLLNRLEGIPIYYIPIDIIIEDEDQFFQELETSILR